MRIEFVFRDLSLIETVTLLLNPQCISTTYSCIFVFMLEQLKGSETSLVKSWGRRIEFFGEVGGVYDANICKLDR